MTGVIGDMSAFRMILKKYFPMIARKMKDMMIVMMIMMIIMKKMKDIIEMSDMMIT